MPARAIPGETDLATLRPDIAAQWDTERNSQPPSMFTQGSNARAWWICEAGHSWDMPIKRRTAGQGCPVCAGKPCDQGGERSCNPQTGTRVRVGHRPQ